MSNSYFKFKQFTIHQDCTAMKVGTDGILLGAWAPVGRRPGRILDIGTGTGVMAIMMAQRCEAVIDGVELDDDACRQAGQNMADSPWSERLCSYHSAIQEYETSERYDLIICNPPFYQDAYGMTNDSRSNARHGTELRYDDLMTHVSRLLGRDGRFATILPSHLAGELVTCAATHGLHPEHISQVYSKPGKPAKRRLMTFSRCDGDVQKDELTVETENHHCYTPEFRALTKDFYLDDSAH